jgi:hypothetical protein
MTYVLGMGLREGTAKSVMEIRQDCRKAMRIPFRMAVRATIYPPPGCEADTAKYTHVLTQDLSREGASVIFGKELVAGQRLDLELPDRCRSAVVCRVENMNDGHYLIACRFDDLGT